MNKSAVFLSIRWSKTKKSLKCTGIYYKIEKSESPKLGRMFKEEVT